LPPDFPYGTKDWSNSGVASYVIPPPRALTPPSMGCLTAAQLEKKNRLAKMQQGKSHAVEWNFTQPSGAASSRSREQRPTPPSASKVQFRRPWNSAAEPAPGGLDASFQMFPSISAHSALSPCPARTKTFTTQMNCSFPTTSFRKANAKKERAAYNNLFVSNSPQRSPRRGRPPSASLPLNPMRAPASLRQPRPPSPVLPLNPMRAPDPLIDRFSPHQTSLITRPDDTD